MTVDANRLQHLNLLPRLLSGYPSAVISCGLSLMANGDRYTSPLCSQWGGVTSVMMRNSDSLSITRSYHNQTLLHLLLLGGIISSELFVCYFSDYILTDLILMLYSAYQNG